MHFALSTPDKKFKNRLSFMIVKNPNNIYSFTNRDGRVVFAKFDADEYKGFVINEYEPFLRVARKLNMTNYIHHERTCISPYNLKMFDKVFSSAIRGNNQTEIKDSSAVQYLKENNIEGFNLTDDEFMESADWRIVVGPMYTVPDHTKDVFDQANINTEFQYVKSEHFDNKYVYDLVLTTKEKMSLTEFLQKVYILLYYLTIHVNTLYPERAMKDIVDKFARLSKSWINTYPYKNKVIKRLSIFKPEVMEKFNDLVKDDTDVNELEEDEEVDKEIDKGLHEKRHDVIIDFINRINCIDFNINSVMDLGSSTGKFLYKLIERNVYDELDKYIAIDKSNFFDRKIRNILRKHYGKKVVYRDALHEFATLKNDVIKHKVKCYKQNALFPYYDESDLLPDCLVVSEFIEHFDKKDRLDLYRYIRNYIKPKYIVFTTPNYEYNVNYGMEKGEYRHRDHKIEFTKSEFENELQENLGLKYECEFDDSLEPSLIAMCTYNEVEAGERFINYQIHNEHQEWYSELFLPTADFTVRPRNMEEGLRSNVLNNKKNVFYISPTMAPVEWTETVPNYMEHPVSAFEYYAERLPYGHTGLIQQKKYMGSRAYILAFKTDEIAKSMGYNTKVIVNSNGGFPFFDGNDELSKNHEKMIHDDIFINNKQALGYMDFVMLDAEFLPWGYKSRKSIDWDFTIPLFCEYDHINKVENSGELQNELLDKIKDLNVQSSDQMNDVIKLFSGYIDNNGEDPHFRVFNIIAYGVINVEKGKITDFVNNYYSYNHKDIIDMIHSSFSDTNKMLKPVETRYINDIYDKDEIEISIREWEIYCEKGGEGFVYKPMIPHMFLHNGYPLQPALKVRGPEYLKLVYGPYYKNYLHILKNRRINKKRFCAITQNEVSKLILQSFLKNNLSQKDKFIGAFKYIENINRNIDATL